MRLRLIWLERCLLAWHEWHRRRFVLKAGTRADAWREFYR